MTICYFQPTKGTPGPFLQAQLEQDHRIDLWDGVRVVKSHSGDTLVYLLKD